MTAAPCGARAEAAANLRAPFALLRIAGIPLAALIDTIPRRTNMLIDEVLAKRALMEDVKPHVILALHDAVPHLDPRTRADVLSLKRAVHSDRVRSAKAHNHLASVPAIRDPGSVRAWIKAAEAAFEMEAQIDEILDAELRTHVRPGLAALVRSESFMKPLAIASPTLFCRATRSSLSEHGSIRDRKVERSLLAYLVRASAKTSPFSTFMYVGLMRLGPSGDRLPTLDWAHAASWSRLARCAEFSLTKGLPVECGRVEHCCFRIDPTVAWRSCGAEVFRPAYGNRRGRILQIPEPALLELSPAICRAVAGLREAFSWGDLLDVLSTQGLNPEAAKSCAYEMFGSGLIVPDQHAGRSEEIAPSNAGTCHTSSCTDAASNRQRLSRMHARASNIAKASGRERARLLQQIAEDGGRQLSDVQNGGTPVFEAAYFAQPVLYEEGQLNAAVAEISEVLASRVGLSWHYRLARDAFVGLYGKHGTCVDVVGFLRRITSLIRPSREAMFDAAGIHPLPLGAKAPVTVTFQIEAGGRGTPGAGDEHFVLNAVHSGCGWLSAYHAMGDTPFHAVLTARLRTWLARLASPVRPADLRAGGRWNDLQLHPELTDLTILPPGELPSSSAEITWRDLVLKHSERTGLIEFVHADEPVAPFYLGASKPNLSWGPVYWLIVLTSPFTVMPLVHTPPRGLNGDDVIAWDRDTRGQVVVQRAAWWMSAERLLRVWFRRSGGARLLDIRIDCVRCGIPDRFFARRWSRTRSDNPFELPKPLWVDIRHPLTLDLLEAEVRRGDILCLTEALPRDPGFGGYVAEIHAEIVL